jgi:hypothetical protein
MTAQLSALTIAAASVGFIHTILGPDHYLPFAVLSWARFNIRTRTATSASTSTFTIKRTAQA